MPLENDVLEIGKQLEKIVAEGNADNESGIDLLKRLREVPITLDILQKTRIGMAVNVVRKASSREEVQSIAKTLIKSWKKLLDGDKPKTPRQASQEKNNDSISRSSSNTSFTRSDSNSSNSNSVSSQPVSNKKDSIVSIPPMKGDVAVRTRCREMISTSLKTDKRPGCDFETLAAEIEEAIFQQFRETSLKYKNKIKSRVLNLRDKRNVELKLLIIDNAITPEKFAVMTSEEMACDELKKQREEITKQAIKDHQLAKTTGTSSGEFKCGKCGKRNTTYNQMQTRSADEPMTTFVYCMECGNRWKFC